MPKDDGLELMLEIAEGEPHYLYGGEVELFFDSKLHIYYVVEDGIKYLVPGVTTVIASAIDKSAALSQWAANECLLSYAKAASTSVITEFNFLEEIQNHKFAHKKISQNALNVGSMAHDWLESRIKEMVKSSKVFPPLPENDQAQKAIEAALSWMNEHEFTPLDTERKIYSRIWNFTGTLDFTGTIKYKGKHIFVIGDFKTSKAIYTDYRMQSAAYQDAWEEEFGAGAIDARVILRLGKDDAEFEAQVLEHDDHFERDIDGFRSALGVYAWSKSIYYEEKEIKDKAKQAKIAAKPPKPAKKIKIGTAAKEDIGMQMGE